MHYSLRELEAKLLKIVVVTTTEIEIDPPEPGERDLRGQYVFRDNHGSKFMWGPRPFRYEMHDVQTVTEADEIQFLCPACFAKNGGATGTHMVLVTFAERNVPDDAGSKSSDGLPSRWVASGTSLDDLVLTPSILLDSTRPPTEGCHWHGFVGSSGIPPGHAG